MRLTLVTLDRFKSQECLALVNQYLKLAGRFLDIKHKEFKTSARNTSDEVLLKYLNSAPSRTLLVILDEKGRCFSSQEFAAQIEKWKTQSWTEVVIAVGGPHGYNDAIKARAGLAWSLSPATMAHELATAVACEQLYRGLSILAAHPYHND